MTSEQTRGFRLASWMGDDCSLELPWLTTSSMWLGEGTASRPLIWWSAITHSVKSGPPCPQCLPIGMVWVCLRPTCTFFAACSYFFVFIQLTHSFIKVRFCVAFRIHWQAPSRGCQIKLVRTDRWGLERDLTHNEAETCMLTSYSLNSKLTTWTWHKTCLAPGFWFVFVLFITVGHIQDNQFDKQFSFLLSVGVHNK